jgi:hypothetical protein
VTHIYERLFLNCPYVRAREYLREELEAADRKATQKATHSLTFTVPPVLVRYERGRDPLHFDEPWNVYWTPEHGGPYPDFSGEMTVRANETYRGAMLEISGDYSPPFGAVGRAFDMAAGAKMASATARALLGEIAERLEERYRVDEAAKNEAVG